MSCINILHLEDSVLDADLVRSRLAKDGLQAQIDRVVGRTEFLEALQARRYDLILADYSLPSFDGLSALEIAISEAPSTPFLFVSGVMGEEVAIESLKRGATDYVLKHRLERLGPAVRRALSEARERLDRRKAEAALRESERLHRLTLDSVKDYAILTMDTEGRIIQTNAGTERVLGYREDELIGQSCGVLYTPEDNLDRVPRRELDRAGARGVGDDERWHVRKDGSRFWGSGLVMPLLDEAGQLRGFTKVVRDMTERKNAEEALIEADRRKDEFLAMLAHELRNPLSAIHNAAQLARRPELPADKLEWTRDVISNQVKHLAHLVDDLLDVSRITRGKIRLRLEKLDLAAILNRAVETARPLIDAKHHHLLVSIESDSSMLVQGDAVRLEQVFVNLLANAAKYTEPGGQIALIAFRDGPHQVTGRVIDDGVGIDPVMLPRVFDLFTQVDKSLDRSQGGLGIGLTIARRLVEFHGGTIEADSDGPGRGSVFTVRLPALAESGAIETRTRVAPKVVPPGSKILVVDDNRDTAGALAGMLEFSGFEVRSVHDGRQAIEAARVHQPSAVLLDIGLPGMDGYEVAEKLRLESGLEDATIIAITGYGEEQAFRRSREAGFDHHLVKPVNYETLLDLLIPDEPPGSSNTQGHA